MAALAKQYNEQLKTKAPGMHVFPLVVKTRNRPLVEGLGLRSSSDSGRASHGPLLPADLPVSLQS